MEIKLDKKLLSLSEISKVQLSKVLNFDTGPKDLILESDIIKPLERICGVKWLKGHGVDKIFKLESTKPYSTTNSRFYIVNAHLATFHKVVSSIKSQIKLESPSQKFHVVVVPRLLYVFEKLIEEEGLFDSKVKLYSFQWMPIALDTSILSLELKHLYRDVYVNQDLSLLPAIGKSLWHLNFVVGKPKFVLAVGQYSVAALQHLGKLKEELADTDRVDSDIGGLVLMDRNLDYPSALLTPSTYSGLLNEVYNITCGICEHKDEKCDEYDDKFNKTVRRNCVQFALDSNNDAVYKTIGHMYFTEVTAHLSAIAKTLRSESSETKGMGLDDIKKYVSKQLQELTVKKKKVTNHIAAAETIVNALGHKFERQQDVEQNILQNRNKSGNYNYLEEILTTDNNQLTSLRLACLMSITQKLTQGEVNEFFSKYLQEFGLEFGYVYDNLMRAGFIPEESSGPPLPNIVNKIPQMFSGNNFYGTTNKLKLIRNDPSKVDFKSPTCCSYVFGGVYTPLVAQIASMVLSKVSVDELKSKLEPLGLINIKGDCDMMKPKTLLVYVVGGITYAEIAACSLLEALTGSKIVVCSDRIINGNNLMEALIEV